jgi:hypothetical protein
MLSPWRVAVAAVLLGTTSGAAESRGWSLDNLQIVGKARPVVWGNPRVVDGATVFDGVRDGLLMSENPLAGWTKFTVQILFCPAEGGGAAQRFFHAQDGQGEGMRAMIETRLDGKGGWWLDTFLRTDRAQLTLIEPRCVHPTGQSYWVALRYDGTTMAHFVNGEKEAEGTVAFGPMVGGKISLGVRQNQVFWFKGAMREVRFTPEALPAEQLQRVKPVK